MKKDLNALLAFYMAMGLYGSPSPFGNPNFKEGYQELSEEDKARLMAKIREENKKRLLRKGLKEFTIDGITVIALNEKNAKRKINKTKRK